MEPNVLAGIFAALGVFTFFVGLAALVSYKRWQKRLRANIGQYADGAASARASTPVEAPSDRLVRTLNERVRDLSVIPRLRKQLITAGIEMPASRFLLLRISLGLLLAIIGLMLPIGGFGIVRILIALAGFVVGYFLTQPVVAFKRSRRLKAFDNQLPDAIDVLAGTLEAGSSLAHAMNLAAREMSDPVSTEFSLAVRDQELGLSQMQALERMLDRVPNDDLDMLLTAINIQYRVGGNLAHVLRSISVTIRERQRVKREIKVLTAQGRISAKVVTAVPCGLVLIMFLMNPSYVSVLFTTNLGRAMTGIALVMMVLGYVVMNRIVAIKV